jgi:hypothetical protein
MAVDNLWSFVARASVFRRVEKTWNFLIRRHFVARPVVAW